MDSNDKHSFLDYQKDVFKETEKLTGHKGLNIPSLSSLLKLKEIGRYIGHIDTEIQLLEDQEVKAREELENKKGTKKDLLFTSFFPYDFPLILAYFITGLTEALELFKYAGIAVFKSAFEWLAKKFRARRVYHVLPLAFLILASFFLLKQLVIYYDYNKNHFKLIEDYRKALILGKKDIQQQKLALIQDSSNVLMYLKIPINRELYYLTPMIIYYLCQLMARFGIIYFLRWLGELLFPVRKEITTLKKKVRELGTLKKKLKQIQNYAMAVQGSLQSYCSISEIQEDDLHLLNNIFFIEYKRLLHQTVIKNKIKNIFKGAWERQEAKARKKIEKEEIAQVKPKVVEEYVPEHSQYPEPEKKEDSKNGEKIYQLIEPLGFEADLHNEICQQIEEKKQYKEVYARLAILNSLGSDITIPLLYSNPSLLLVSDDKFRTYFSHLYRVINRIKSQNLENLYNIHHSPESFSHIYSLLNLEKDIQRTIANIKDYHEAEENPYHKKKSQFKRIILLGGEHYLKDKIKDIEETIGGIKILHYPNLISVKGAMSIKNTDLIVIYRRSIGHELISKFEKYNRSSSSESGQIAKTVGFEQKNISILKNFLIDQCYGEE